MRLCHSAAAHAAGFLLLNFLLLNRLLDNRAVLFGYPLYLKSRMKPPGIGLPHAPGINAHRTAVVTG